VAIDIFHRAAALLRDQVVALHRFYPDAANLPIMVMGGSFKNYLLLDLFSKAIAETYPGRTVQKPIFEPVAGGVFCYLKELGLSDENAKEIMLQNFSTELYPLPQK
jgi:hypothetical protein